MKKILTFTLLATLIFSGAFAKNAISLIKNNYCYAEVLFSKENINIFQGNKGGSKKFSLVYSEDSDACDIYDLELNKEVQTLPYNSCVNFGVSDFSSDNKLVVTVGNTNEYSGDMNNAKIWNIKTGECLHTLSHQDIVRGAKFSSDNKMLVTVSFDRVIKIWDVQSGECLQTLEHDNYSDATDFYAEFILNDKYIVLKNMWKNHHIPVKIWGLKKTKYGKNTWKNALALGGIFVATPLIISKLYQTLFRN